MINKDLISDFKSELEAISETIYWARENIDLSVVKKRLSRVMDEITTLKNELIDLEQTEHDMLSKKAIINYQISPKPNSKAPVDEQNRGRNAYRKGKLFTSSGKFLPPGDI
ncbi:hypothetical protein ACIQZM_18050 [Peribacillus sp. NPDC097206]|uniref:hypothetical protein n=1 Tax=unclassified Peribacillus TaxID=2675266 RepID=UPI00380DE36B